jgi:hypothetical protein
VQQDCEKLLFLPRQLPTDRFDIQAFMFRLICDTAGKHGMVDESIVLYEEMYNASVRRMDLQILRSKALSRRELLADSGGIWIERSVGLQWLLITYAHTYDDPFNIGNKAVD